MKAVVVSTPGGPEVLEVVERPKPVLKAGWTLVKIQGFGINHSEIFTRKGQSPSVKFPRVLGIECVGLVSFLPQDRHTQSLTHEEILQMVIVPCG